MTATERLHAMLDEHGIKYVTLARNCTVAYTGGVKYKFYEYAGPSDEVFDGKVFVVSEWFTPEQAIAATVGEEYEMRICKRCGVAYELNILDKGFGKPRFCPNCGYREMYQ